MVVSAMDLIGATDSIVGAATEMMLLANAMSNGTMSMGSDSENPFVEVALGLVENTINTTMRLGESSAKYYVENRDEKTC